MPNSLKSSSHVVLGGRFLIITVLGAVSSESLREIANKESETPSENVSRESLSPMNRGEETGEFSKELYFSINLKLGGLWRRSHPK